MRKPLLCDWFTRLLCIACRGRHKVCQRAGHLLAAGGSRFDVVQLLQRVERAGQELQSPGECCWAETLACMDHQLSERVIAHAEQ